MNKIILSENFNLNEFKVSAKFPDVAEKMKFSELEVDTLKLLAQSILQPIRDRYCALYILSGKRDKDLNVLVRGASTSDHLTCNASDFHAKSIDAFDMFKWVVSSKLPYRQIIFYPEANPNFVHVSINIPGKIFKNEALIYRDKKYNIWS